MNAAEYQEWNRRPYHVGPDGFVCRLGEPEDRIWIRDGQDAVDRLNEQHAEIERLRALLVDATNCLDCHSDAGTRRHWAEAIRRKIEGETT